MNLTVFLQLQLKRLWKNKLFLFLLVAFPVCLFLLSRSFRSEEDSRIPVGIYLATEDTLTATLCEKLISLEDSFLLYQQGITKLKHCNDKIDAVEKKLLILNEEGQLV